MEALQDQQPADPGTNPDPLQTGTDALAAGDKSLEERNKKFRQQLDLCKLYRRKLVRDWQVNVDYRRGKPFSSQSDEDRIAVPVDWTLTKQKQAALFSQVPAIRISHPPETQSPATTPWLHAFEQRINDLTVTAGIESIMDECIPDCINAAGFGAAIVMREAITENVEVPAIDITALPPFLQQTIASTGKMPDGSEIPMETVPREVDFRYTISRISPADFLWPIGFQSSDFDKAPFIGRSGRVPWATAVQRFGLTEADKARCLGDDRSTLDRIDRLRHETERGVAEFDDTVPFDELFYYEHQYDSEAKSFQTIHHLVFVHGKEKPVIDEPWKGQRQDEQSGQLIGAMCYPIRVLTLSYITDDAIPPSDSAVARPPVDEINKSRSQMIQQRQHSMPMRWANTDKVDQSILYTMMRGQWQGIIPIQGVGTNAFGEISRSGMPQENFAFDKIAKQDIAESWGSGGNLWDVVPNGEDNSKVGFSADPRVARERARVANFFLGISEVVGGLASLFEDPASFGEGFSPLISKALAYSVLADSTILLDSNQKLQRLMQFINFTVKSGWVNIEPVLREIATLSGLDPTTVIRPPEPKPPVEPNISLRLTGVEDLLNPLALAHLIKSGQAPDAAAINQAKQLIAVSVAPYPGMPAPPQIGPDGQPIEGGPPTATPLAPGEQPLPQPGPVPQPAPPAIGAAHPEWNAMPRVNQRVVGPPNSAPEE